MTDRAGSRRQALVDDLVAHARARVGAAAEQADDVEAFVRRYFAEVPTPELLALSPVDLSGAALAHRDLARDRKEGTPRVLVYTPVFDRHGWQSSHSVVEIVTDDMPFLVDSVTMVLNRKGYGLHLAIHPIIEEPGRPAESFIHIEFDRQGDVDALAELEAAITSVLGDVRAAVDDWPAMRDRAALLASELRAEPPPVEEDVEEVAALLEWMADDHFTFLGFREYDLTTLEGEEVLRSVAGSGLGILGDRDRGRNAGTATTSVAKLPPLVRQKAHEPTLLNLTKANTVSTVHRPAYLDYVGIKRFDDEGEVVGEHRFLGLFTSVAYNSETGGIPVVRRKVAEVMDGAGFAPGSHNWKDLAQILETLPRDEIFDATPEQLGAIATGVLELQGRRRVRLFARRDAFGRFVTCLVYLPRDRYTTTVRLRMQELLVTAFGGERIEYYTSLGESVLARLHFVVHTDPADASWPNVDDVEIQLAAAARSWSDDLHDALIEQCGEEVGVDLGHRYADAFPASYQADFDARIAVADIRRIDGIGPEGLGLHLYRPLGESADVIRFRLYRTGERVSLSTVLPLLSDMGVVVLEQRPYPVTPIDGTTVWLYEFVLRTEGERLHVDRVRDVFEDAFARAWRGETESDGFNRLVLQAGLGAADVGVLRTYCKYLRQGSTRFSQRYMEATLSVHPVIARQLVELFHVRFDPDRTGAPDEAEDLVARIAAALDDVPSLDEDQILRSFLAAIQATLRTNFFQGKPYLSLKLDPGRVPDLPKPLPAFEIFVCSPRVEGVHLRSGPIARGGIRWSDRREDFRTEILGLMKAQQAKNVVIVPVGAKGGFIVKHPPVGDEVVACYSTLIRGMLDLTDNIVAGKVVLPPRVVRYDADDPYLVVAADKGTATFSDVANEISAEYGFWLGDAFASGGSRGYDHKAMGITARGAWESVVHHFLELGVDARADPITVAGIGDMSGDVFGNGMLLSRGLKLVAAFDHRHVFLDPDPDPEASFAERERLFRLPRSSWSDYDTTLLSEGGGVFPRTAKSIPLSAQVRAVLAVEATELPPNDLVRAVLRAPVDLLWNGGIGTYVRASVESDADVGDKTNDPVRVAANELRARVVGEGGNLGFTQLGRIELALHGGRINTDAIDNSAGVDCSDHEVNIKILLDAVVADGDLTAKQRNALLVQMTDEVAALVVRDNYEQNQALTNARAEAAPMLDVHARLIHALEQQGDLERALEFLPDAEGFEDRQARGLGLTSPEFAVLLAYSKIAVAEAIEASDLPTDPYLERELVAYFPSVLRSRFADRIAVHPLRRSILTTALTNQLVNRAGISFAFRLAEETGATVADLARAHFIAREVFDLPALWMSIAELEGSVESSVRTGMLLKARTLAERATRWLVLHRRPPLDVAGSVAFFRTGAAAVDEAVESVLTGPDRATFDAAVTSAVERGVPEPLARAVARLTPRVATFDIVEVATATSQPASDVAAVHFALGYALGLDWLRDRIWALPRSTRWGALARGALRDDLFTAHRSLVADVVRTTAETAPAGDRVAAWLSQNRAAADRAAHVLGDIGANDSFDLATLSVGLREINNILRSTG